MLWQKIMERATLDAPMRLREICIDPFERRVGAEIPHITVSNELNNFTWHCSKIDGLLH